MSYAADKFTAGDFPTLLGGDDSGGGNTGVAYYNKKVAPTAVPNTSALRKGVYATFPASTPKYSTANDDRSLKTQARLLIPLPNNAQFQTFMKSYKGYSNDVRQMAELLVALPPNEDKGHARRVGYLDFLLTSAQETFEEKVQIDDVVGDNFVAYFFGQRPPIFSYQGVLMNTQQDDWRAAMTMIYLNILRGTQLARRNVMVTLAYDKYAITGAFMNLTQVLTAEMQMASTFSFQMLVKRIDLERTQGSLPTYIGGFPAAVRPDSFAMTTFETPKVTMRTTATPTDAVEERKKVDTPAAQEVSVSDEPDPTTGAPTTTSRATEPPEVYGATKRAAYRAARAYLTKRSP